MSSGRFDCRQPAKGLDADQDVYQSESITTYKPNLDSSVGVHTISRIYDRDGKAKYDRIKDFVMEKFAEIDFPSLKYLGERREFFSYWLRNSGYLNKKTE